MTLGERVRSFPIFGLGIGVVLSAWVTLVYVIAGSAPFQRNGVTFVQTVAVYLTAGPLGGLLVALAHPLYRSIVGAFALGTLALFPAYLGFGILEIGNEHVSSVFLVALLAALLVGGSVGVGSWLDDNPRDWAPAWVNSLRYPTGHTLLYLWAAACLLAATAWLIGGRWAGHWPAVIAIPLFLIPLGFATGITVVAIRRRTRRDAS